MNLWTSIKTTVSGWVRKSRLFRSMVRRVGIEPSFNLAQYADYVREGYQTNPNVYAAIRETAQSVAEIPPKLFRVTAQSGGDVARALEGYERKGHSGRRAREKKRRAASRVMASKAQTIKKRTGLPAALCRQRARKSLVETGELEPVESHELLDLLDHPNPYTQRSYGQYIQALVTELEIGGEVLQEPVNTSNGMPREIYVHGPKQLRIDGDGRQPIQTIHLEGEEFSYDPDPSETELFYHKYYNPARPLRGQSPAMAAARSIDINNEGRGWNLALLQNGAEFSGILSFEEQVSQENRESWREQIKKMDPGDILPIDGSPVSFESFSMSPKDMRWMDLNKASAREVAIVWNVPPQIIGDVDSQKYSNYKVARRAWYMEKIIPLTSFVYGELNSSLVPLFGDDLLLDYDLSTIDALQEDVNEQHERIREDVKAGILSINEARTAIGREEVDSGDTILIPSTQVPLTTSPAEEDDEEERSALMAEYGGDGEVDTLPTVTLAD